MDMTHAFAWFVGKIAEDDVHETRHDVIRNDPRVIVLADCNCSTATKMADLIIEARGWIREAQRKNCEN